MKYNFIKYTDDLKDEWQNTQIGTPHSSFISSLLWINFQKKLGKETDQYLIEVEDKNGSKKFIGNLYLEISRRRFTKYAYSPYGPVFRTGEITPDLAHENRNVHEEFFRDLKKFGKKYCREHKLNLFKIDPILGASFIKDLKKWHWKKSLSPGQAKDIWSMFIADKKNFSIANLKKDTRYYINRAEKKGVEIIKATTIEEVKEFAKLMNETTERKGFVNYNAGYYEKQWLALNESGMTEIWLAKYQNKYISGALINYNRSTLNYSHGASTSDKELANLASPYLLHWRIIEDAMDKEYSGYNFWGVLPKEVKNHPWRGLSDFKMKFPGKMESYVGTWEVYSNPFKYYLNRLYDWWVFRGDRY
jgi:lipid II:glycine glycyltransferase (peptidoglycan interpeptide bridge formation enzyme)